MEMYLQPLPMAQSFTRLPPLLFLIPSSSTKNHRSFTTRHHYIRTSRFPVGGAAAEDYAPIVINLDVTSPGSSLTVTTQQGDHYAEILSRLISSKSVNCTWSITNNGLGYSSCEITFNWDSADVDAGTIYGNFGVGEWRAASWAYPVANSVTATSITVTGVILSAEYAVAELEPQQDPGTYRTYADGDWNDVANWLVYDGNTWLPASTPPDNSSVAVQVHHKMVVNSPASGNNVVVENAPATVLMQDGSNSHSKFQSHSLY